MKWLDKFKTMKKDKLILLLLAGILLVVIKLPAKNTVKTKSSEYNIQSSAKGNKGSKGNCPDSARY